MRKHIIWAIIRLFLNVGITVMLINFDYIVEQFVTRVRIENAVTCKNRRPLPLK